MENNRRVLLAFVLTFGVITLWASLVSPPRKQEGSGAGLSIPQATAPAAEPTSTPLARLEPAAALPPSPTRGEAREVVVRTGLATVRISGLGGVVRSWRLEDYRQHPPASPEAEVPRVDLVEDVPATSPYQPLGVIVGDRGLDARLAAARYEIRGGDLDLAPGERGTIELEWRDGSGSEVHKRLEFVGGSYRVELLARAKLAAGAPILTLGPGLCAEVEATHSGAYAGRAVTLLHTGKVVRHLPAEVDHERLVEAGGGRWPPASDAWLEVASAAGQVLHLPSPRWVAVDENYFAGALFASQGTLREGLAYPVPEPAVDGKLRLGLGVRLEGETRVGLYVGPKDTAVLEAVQPDLVEVVEFGIMSTLAHGLLLLLRFFHRYVHDYGLAIILLTVVVKVVFLPLTIKQLSMMQKMTRLRPLMKQIEDRHARARSDPKQRAEATRKRQEEMMALYQKEGVNPASGCLPLLLQLPVLWAFYSLLGASMELRQAEFLWLQDLSAKDPTRVTPILMLISMVVLQALTPAVGDPMQRRLMFAMPVFFFFVFKDLASGLVLYWLTQNVLSIVQQVIMNRLAEDRERQEKEARRGGRIKRARKGA